MSKKIFKNLILVTVMAVLCMAVAMTASAAKEGYYTYSVGSDGTATITDVDTSISGDVVIPNTLGGYSVTSIGDYAFYYCTSLTSITIPDSVTSIGDYAFDYCTSLTSITVDENNEYYSSDEYGVLFNKDKTELIKYPAGNTRTSYTIPDSVTSIGESAFLSCTSLISITVDENNEYYSSDEYGVLFNKDKTELIQCPIGNTRASYTIPDSVTSIGSYAFCYCESLTSITIPDSVTSIGYRAFEDCTSLTSVTIGNSVTSIGSYAFWCCESLESVTIGNSVTSIGDGAFCYCESLTSVTIPDSVTSIGDFAFSWCTSLTNITIPDSVTSIGDGAFYVCTSLTSITIPDSVTSIGKKAFYNCTSLESITIPDSVTSIGEDSFCDCTSLTSITIPDSVTSIGEEAFWNCTSLTNAHYCGTQEEWDVISIGDYNTYLTDIIHMATDEDGDGICDLCPCVYTSTKTAPTCTENGYITYTCACGNSYTETIPSTGHSYVSSVTAATCTADGYTTYTCACGDTYTETIPSTGHSYVSSVTAATCTANGYTTYTCHCGDSYTETISSTGHSYVSSVTAPTCTADGYTTYTCHCGDSYTETISATGHGDANADGKCDNCGFDMTEGCDCNCHKEGFAGFIWKFLEFFYKLFRTKTYCECGMIHY